MNKFYLTGIGPDKPGIVAALTKIVTDLSGNIVDTSMTMLGSQFALLMSITLPAEKSLEAVQQSFKPIEQELGFTVFVKQDTATTETTSPAIDGEPHMISIAGEDKTGITYEFTQILAKFDINITDLNAQSIVGEDDKQVYILMIECIIGSHVDRSIFERDLAMMGEQLNVEVTYHSIEALAL